ncbi:MAG: rhomboid family intramembrane serine protease [Nonlabens ulvanivorans]|uniref:rhomboid family intramembrane serine protease n=5 Tax=Nonlabens ulvanivorans TaxID=906888 RepID=UPI003264F3A2
MNQGLDIVTIVIIVACALVSFKGFQDRFFFDKYKFNIARILRGEQLRFLTSGFLHADLQHLIFNMLTLYFFAHYVVVDLGDIGFLVVYFASLLGGGVLSYLFHQDEYHYSAIGASGAVMGIIYSAILLEPGIYIYGIIPGFVFAIGYLAYSIYGMKNKSDNIGHDAHFGGAVAGYVVTILYDYHIIFEQTLTVVLMLLPIIALFILKKMGKL